MRVFANLLRLFTEEISGIRVPAQLLHFSTSASGSAPDFLGLLAPPERIHWSVPDPSAAEGTETERLAAFDRAAKDLLTRIRDFVTLVERTSGR